MVEVFKTNISKIRQSRNVIKKLLAHFPASYVNIDMDDCDRVLRVEGEDICPNKIMNLVIADGYYCEVLV